MPQSGRTTLLNALTRGRAEEGASGSSRQEVHTGVIRMPDTRLDTLAKIFNPDKIVPVQINYLDVPANREATDGSGISGQFLNLLQGADALLLVIRAFDNPSVPHVSGSVDPQRDAANMEADLAFSDLGILERRAQRIEASLKGARDRERDILLAEAGLVQRVREGLEQGAPVREQQVLPVDRDTLANYQLLTAKPLLIGFNIDEAALPGASELESELASPWAGKVGARATTFCGKLELELSELAPEEEQEFRESMGLQGSSLDRLVQMSYELLSLVSFFTYVSKEARAWTVPTDTPAVKAAGKIHSDMERGFIRAEVIAFEDLARCGSVAECRKQGHLRLEGKTYPVRDGDVITFLFNV